MHVYDTISLTARSKTDSDLNPLRDVIPDATDTRLHGVTTDADGTVTGTPRKRDVTDTTDPETGESVVSVMLAATSESDAVDLWGDLTTAVGGIDATGKLHRQPLGSQTPSEVRDWYRDHPDDRPTDSDGNKLIPATWQAGEHTIRSY